MKIKRRQNKDKQNIKNKPRSAIIFSNLNTDKEIDRGHVVTNSKSKITKWVFAFGLLGVTVTGISVPWALSSCEAKARLPINDSEKIIYFKDIYGNVKKYTMAEWTKYFDSYKSSETFLKQWTKEFENSVIKKLYNEEHEAYIKFKAVMSAYWKKEISNTDYGFDASKPYDQIKQDQRKELENDKKTLQTQYGNKFLDIWLSQLKTNSKYGNPSFDKAQASDLSRIEEEAINNMTSAKAKEVAYARFNSAKITTDEKKWNLGILTWNNNDPIKYGDSVIASNQARSYLNSFLIKDSTSQFGSNVATAPGKNEISVFETNSYIPEYRYPNKTFIESLSNYYKSATISNVKLGDAALGNLGESITFGEKGTEFIENLFKLNNENTTVFGISVQKFVAFNQLSNFKGASIVASDNIENKAKDANLIKILSSSSNFDTAKKLGTTGNLTLQDQIASSASNRELNLGILGSQPELFDPAKKQDYQLYSIKKQNPFKIFIKALFSITGVNSKPNFDKNWMLDSFSNVVGNEGGSTFNVWQLVSLLKQNYNLNNNSELEWKGTDLTQYNKDLKTLTSNLNKDTDLKYLGALLLVSLTDDPSLVDPTSKFTAQEKLKHWTLYELSPGTYLHVSKTLGLNIVSLSLNVSKDQNKIKEMINWELNASLNKDTFNTLYEIDKIYSKFNTNPIIINQLLDQPENAKVFKDAIKEKISDEKEAERIFNQFKSNNQAKMIAEIEKASYDSTTNISTLIDGWIKNKDNYEFAIQTKGSLKDIIWQIEDNNSLKIISTGIGNIKSDYVARLKNILNVKK